MEYQRICLAHLAAVQTLSLIWLTSHRKAFDLSDSEFEAVLMKLHQKLVGVPAEDLSPDSCALELADLAWKWKLKIHKPVVGMMLFIDSVREYVQSLGIVPKLGPALHPHYAAEDSPLKIEIHTWQVIDKGQDEIVKHFKEMLGNYTENLRQQGATDFPSSLEEHARWWFEKYALQKKYKEIAELYITQEETVKNQVWKFRRLMHIALK